MTLVTAEDELEIRRLFFAEHWPVGTIAAQLGVHPDVVRRLAGLLSPKRRLPSQPSLVSPFVDFIDAQLALYPTLRATRIYDMVVARGYDGSVRTVRGHVACVRPRRRREAFVRTETLIGEQAQIDWAYVGTVRVDGGERALWLFVMVLSWSRGMWGEFVLDISAHSLARSLCAATTFFGGTARQWLFDNPKIVVLGRHGDAVRFHPLLLDVASHHHVQPRLCGVRKANEKGKVERTIRYLRDRFLAGRPIHNVDAGNRELLEFISDIAHARPHPVLAGRTVGDCVAEEKTRLLAPPTSQLATDAVVSVVVDKTAFVRFDTNSYSVPPEHVGCTLTLVANDKLVRVIAGDVEVASHARNFGKKRVVEDPAHRAAILSEKRGARDHKGRDRLRQIAPRIDALLQRWLDDGRNVGNCVGQSLRILDLYGDDVFQRAVDDVVDRGLADTGALASVCEQLRQRDKKVPPAVAPTFAAHVKDRDVSPTDMETYDRRKRR